MDFILKEEESGVELLFPVTPSSYEDYTLMNAKKINAYAIGDINLIGNAGTGSVTITGFFPTERRSYTNGSAYVGNPSGARELLDGWCSGKKLCRLIIGGDTTDVNRKCFISSLRWYKGGKDMSNDLYCDIKLAYYTDLEAVEVNTDTGNNGRADDIETAGGTKDYIIKKGDTLWDIAKAEYGDPSLCWQLAEYNGVKNANLIYAGDSLKIPDKSELTGLSYTGSKQSVSGSSSDTPWKEDPTAWRNKWVRENTPMGGSGGAMNAVM